MLIYESMGNMESEDASTLTLQHVRFQTIGYFYTLYQFQDPNPRLIISVQKKRSTCVRQTISTTKNKEVMLASYIFTQQTMWLYRCQPSHYFSCSYSGRSKASGWTNKKLPKQSLYYTKQT